MIITLKSIFSDTGFINYIIRLVEKTNRISASTITIEGNWQLPKSGRFDSILTEFFPNQKRSYFFDNSCIHSFQEGVNVAYNETLQEDSKISNKYCYAFEFNFNEYEKNNYHQCVNTLKNYYYIDFQDKMSSKGLTSVQIAALRNFLSSIQDRTKIVGFRFPSKFISSNILPYYNVVILDNNPLYEILINNLYLDHNLYYHN